MEYLKEVLKKGRKASIVESIIFAIIGIVLLCNPVGIVKFIISVIGSIFRIIIGGWIIYSSFITINTALQIRTMGYRSWIFSFILAIIMFLCGLYIVINPGAIIATIGAIMIIYSIIDIIENVIFINKLD